jgi:hypothetical protein
MNRYITVSQTKSARLAIDNEVHDTQRASSIIHNSQEAVFLNESEPQSGQLPSLPTAEPTPHHIRIMQQTRTMQPRTILPINTREGSSQKRRRTNTPDGDEVEPAKRARAEKKCWKCLQSCPGRGNKDICPNPCSDCGRMDCKGKNSRHPTWPCHYKQSLNT